MNGMDEYDFEGLSKLPSPYETAVVLALQGKPVPAHYAALTHECPNCEGYGRWFVNFEDGRLSKDCPNCHGWGWVEKEHAEHVHVWSKSIDGPLFSFSKYCVVCLALDDNGEKRKASLQYRCLVG